jgi:hypothetical protein
MFGHSRIEKLEEFKHVVWPWEILVKLLANNPQQSQQIASLVYSIDFTNGVPLTIPSHPLQRIGTVGARSQESVRASRSNDSPSPVESRTSLSELSPNPRLQGVQFSYRDVVKRFPNLREYRAHYWDIRNDDYFHDDMTFLLQDVRARYLSVGQIHLHELAQINRAIAARQDRYGDQFTLFYYGATSGGHVG